MAGGDPRLAHYGAKDLASPMGAENLFGEWCIADTDLALMLNRLAMPEDVMPDRLTRRAAHQWSRPSVKAWLALERPREATP